ncbi:MAG: diacylglycerol kinase [Burkholderiales bacterium]|nr:diacylglycerol kinase [Burkholderiales bacterium]
MRLANATGVPRSASPPCFRGARGGSACDYPARHSREGRQGGGADTRRRAVVSPHKKKTGLARVRNALLYSLDGLAAAFRHEHAFRQEVLLAIVLVPLALLAPASGTGKALMVAAVLLVLVVELVNSAIEAVVDRVSPEHHELAKRAKDMGSAAVLLALANVPVAWLLVLFG